MKKTNLIILVLLLSSLLFVGCGAIHTSSDWIVDVEATCGMSGERHKECIKCGTVIETEVIEATGNHTVVIDPAVQSTEFVDGLTEGKHCSSCGQILVEQVVVPSLNGGLAVYSSTLVVDLTNKSISGVFANKRNDISFTQHITLDENATFNVYKDKECRQEIANGFSNLSVGNNVFYLLVKNGEKSVLYTVDIFREGTIDLKAAEYYLVYLHYKEVLRTVTPDDFQLVTSFTNDLVNYKVEWWTESDDITITMSDDGSFVNVDVPESNYHVFTYKLNGKIIASDNQTLDFTITNKIPILENRVSKPPLLENTAYKLHIKHPSFTSHLFATTTLDQNNRLLPTRELGEAASFYVEASGDGYKVYTTIDGVKKYVSAVTLADVYAKIVFTETEASVWHYDEEARGWFTYTTESDRDRQHKQYIGSYVDSEYIDLYSESYVRRATSGIIQFLANFITEENSALLDPYPQPITIESTIEEIKKVAIQDLSFDYYKITVTIASTPGSWQGNCNAVDGTGDININNLYLDDNGKKGVLYAQMEEKLDIGDTIVIYGRVSINWGQLEMDQARIVEIIKSDNSQETPSTVDQQ